MQKLNKEKALLEKTIEEWLKLHTRIEDAQVLLEMAMEAKDESTFGEVKAECSALKEDQRGLELKSLLRERHDTANTYLSINSGAGGTEACDWASMLLRMYTRYAEIHGFRCEILEISEGEEAGIKSATLLIEGPFAYGYLKAEVGVHRLVRVSPYDSNARRHTSFASVSAWPEVDEDIQIEIKDEDLEVDTYRASGAGGQHVNRTDSAVRMRHKPSGLVVQCQTQRSQHANRDKALKMLKSALYDLEEEKRRKEREAIQGEKLLNEWGSQIRSYVLHPYQLAKDHRTSFETSNPSAVLDGKLDGFIEAFLKSRIATPRGADASH